MYLFFINVETVLKSFHLPPPLFHQLIKDEKRCIKRGVFIATRDRLSPPKSCNRISIASKKGWSPWEHRSWRHLTSNMEANIFLFIVEYNGREHQRAFSGDMIGRSKNKDVCMFCIDKCRDSPSFISSLVDTGLCTTWNNLVVYMWLDYWYGKPTFFVHQIWKLPLLYFFRILLFEINFKKMNDFRMI